jgi:predicted DNA-binding protein
MMTMVMAYYSNLMAMTQDSMAYLKNNDGNARKYYLRSAVDQYLFSH